MKKYFLLNCIFISSLFLMSAAHADSKKINTICQKPSAPIEKWQQSDWHFCRAKIKRACVNDHAFADVACAKGVMEQTPECKLFSGLVRELDSTLDLLTFENYFPLALISQSFPADGGENYIILTPVCELNLMKVPLSNDGVAVNSSQIRHFSKPTISKIQNNIQVNAPYQIRSCKACAVLKKDVLILDFDQKGALIEVSAGKKG